MRIAIVSTALAIALATTNVQAASDLGGIVRTVNVNKTWGGIFIQLEGAPVFESGSGCANTFAFSPVSDEFTKQFLAIAMAAKASGEYVRIATSGCISTPMGSAPRIEWIDYGNRL